jgi:small nuclear ribonucleoprotein (snRNP)-like protein
LVVSRQVVNQSPNVITSPEQHQIQEAMMKHLEQQKLIQEAIRRLESDALKEKPCTGPNINKLKEYLNRRVLIEIEDGRKFEGRFLCIDKFRNIILSECEEQRQVMKIQRPFEEELLAKNPNDELLKEKIADKKNGIERRTLGFASIPGRTIRKIYVDLNSFPDSAAQSGPTNTNNVVANNNTASNPQSNSTHVVNQQ